MKILNGIKLILDDQGNHLVSYTISLESLRSFIVPLFRKPVTRLRLFFAVCFLQQTSSRVRLLLENLTFYADFFSLFSYVSFDSCKLYLYGNT